MRSFSERKQKNKPQKKIFSFLSSPLPPPHRCRSSATPLRSQLRSQKPDPPRILPVRRTCTVTAAPHPPSWTTISGTSSSTLITSLSSSSLPPPSHASTPSGPSSPLPSRSSPVPAAPTSLRASSIPASSNLTDLPNAPRLLSSSPPSCCPSSRRTLPLGIRAPPAIAAPTSSLVATFLGSEPHRPSMPQHRTPHHRIPFPSRYPPVKPGKENPHGLTWGSREKQIKKKNRGRKRRKKKKRKKRK